MTVTAVTTRTTIRAAQTMFIALPAAASRRYFAAPVRAAAARRRRQLAPGRLRPGPGRAASSTSTSASDHHSRDSETSLPQSRTTTPSRTTATRSHAALAATQRPAAADRAVGQPGADALQTAGDGCCGRRCRTCWVPRTSRRPPGSGPARGTLADRARGRRAGCRRRPCWPDRTPCPPAASMNSCRPTDSASASSSAFAATSAPIDHRHPRTAAGEHEGGQVEHATTSGSSHCASGFANA